MNQIHPGMNIGLQYIRNTDEYILKLQLHQQSDGPLVMVETRGSVELDIIIGFGSSLTLDHHC